MRFTGSAEDSYRQKAYVDGLLYSLKGRRYPALIEGKERIAGELHEVSEQTLKKIDELESYFGEGHPENEYDKKFVMAYAEDGSESARFQSIFTTLEMRKTEHC